MGPPWNPEEFHENRKLGGRRACVDGGYDYKVDQYVNVSRIDGVKPTNFLPELRISGPPQTYIDVICLLSHFFLCGSVLISL